MPFNDPFSAGGMQDPIMAGYGGGANPQQPDPAMAAAMQTPVSGAQIPPMLATPNFSDMLVQVGRSMMATEGQGLGLGGSIAYGLKAYGDALDQKQKDESKSRAEKLAEFEVMSRIKERQMTEQATLRKFSALDQFKKDNPEYGNLAEINPEAAVKAVIEAKKPKSLTPFAGEAMDAQIQNILLQGNPASPVYLAAYNRAAEPKVMQNPQDGSITTITPNMSAYRKPSGVIADAFLQGSDAVAAENAPNQPPPATPGSASMNVGGVMISTSPPTRTPPLSEASAKYAYAAEQMDNAEKILNSPSVAPGVSGQMGKVGTAAKITSSLLPGDLGEATGQGVKNIGFNDAQKNYDTVVDEWVMAKLRAESGASINRDEMVKQRKIFFPTTGDTAPVIAQKAALRADAARAMKVMALSKAPEVMPDAGAVGQPSQTDLEFTAKKYGISVDEVKKKLGIQ